jgi:ArsR family transcriptional regulator, arsenate/arsenite/antimonite-responsive transcriptional repressor
VPELISVKAHMKNSSEAMEQLFQALGDRTRLRLLNLMAEGEVCVCFFVEVLAEPQPKISRHLAYLRGAGLVNARRDARWMHYSITPPENATAKAAFDAVIATLATDRQMQRDRLALMKACCSTKVPEQLRRAPRPAAAKAES